METPLVSVIIPCYNADFLRLYWINTLSLINDFSPIGQTILRLIELDLRTQAELDMIFEAVRKA